MDDFKALMVEARELGVQYNGDDVDELTAYILMARASADKSVPVPCFGVSYDPTDRRCRICQLRDACADKDKKPRIEILEPTLQAIPCGACGKGSLDVACEDEQTGQLRDYACSNVGCPNTVAIQCGWESTGGVADVVFGEDKPEPEAVPEMPIEDKPAPKAKPKAKAKLRLVKNDEPDPKPKAKTKAPPKKPAPKKPAPKKPAPKKPAPKSVGKLVYKSAGKKFSTFSAAITAITGNTAWSPSKFFKGQSVKDVSPGDVFAREWKGSKVMIEVTSE